MHLARLRLRDFRNYARLDAAFAPGFHLILGDNAQGKTNLLEAIYLLATLRSFRGVGGAQLIRHGARGYWVGATIVGPLRHEVKIFWSPRQRKLLMNNQPVRRLADYYGTLRAVVFCSEDTQLIKGPGRVRRRFMDLLLAQTHAPYLHLLQRYTRAVRARNALLRSRRLDEHALAGFTREVVAAGTEIMRLRRELLPRLSPLARAAHARIAPAGEELQLAYQPATGNEDLAQALERSREQERATRLTLVGPHRDEMALLLNGKPAAQFASEGQKRTLALALKMAQAEYLTERQGSPPILLIDDVMVELDIKRRSGFLPLLERSREAQGQVFMTCTEENWPRELSRSLHRWEVRAGHLNPLA
ncbi:MAG: DNA replication/repair protein RecF [Verrucomicrobiae bacterium]|nr:DNA replication/repair protein RecF [Verrucomicrobiae bacterium]